MTAGVFAEKLVIHPHDGAPINRASVRYWLNRDADGIRVVLVDDAGVCVEEIRNVLRTETV